MFALTATPKPTTLRMFDKLNKYGNHEAFHLYSMKQSIKTKNLPKHKVTPKSWTLYQRHLEIFVSGFFVLIFPLGEIAAKLHLIFYIQLDLNIQVFLLFYLHCNILYILQLSFLAR